MSARTDSEASAAQETTGITPETLGATLSHKLEASHVDIQDLSGITRFVPSLDAASNTTIQEAVAKCSKPS